MTAGELAQPSTAGGGDAGSGVVGIVHLYPTLMGTYGDGGNVLVLARRARARGLDVRLAVVGPGEPAPEDGDLYVLGGGEDASQVAAARELRASGVLARAVERGAAVFAVCAGLQVLGRDFEVSGGAVEPGLGLLDATTRRREPRAVGEVLAEPVNGLPLLTGYENHGGGTELGPAARALARVVAGVGNGGGASGDGLEGAIQGRVVATYLHGPVLARNPEFADWLLELALLAATERTGADGAGCGRLAPLDTPFVAELRAEREAYARSGKLSAESARTRR